MGVKVLLILVVVAILMEDSLSVKKRTKEEEEEDKKIAEAVNATLAEEEAERKQEEEERRKRDHQEKKKRLEEGKKEDNRNEVEDGQGEACPPANITCPEDNPCPEVNCTGQCGTCPEVKPCLPCKECPEKEERDCPPCQPCRPCGPCPDSHNGTTPSICQCPGESMTVPVALLVGAAATLVTVGVATGVGLLLRYVPPMVSGFFFISIIIMVWYLSSQYPATARELGGRVVATLREATIALSHRVMDALRHHNDQVGYPIFLLILF
jgi:hypothetical protein